MRGLGKDITHALRSLARSPMYALASILTLTLAIGANGHVFSAVDTYLYDFLPYEEGDELYELLSDTRRWGRSNFSYNDFLDWREQATVFEDLGAWDYEGKNLTGGDRPERIMAVACTAGTWTALAVEPLLGQTFTEDEDQPGGEKVTVLSHRLWQDLFGGAEDVVGRTVSLDSETYTVIGVMPASFWFPEPDEDLWIPLAADPADPGRGSHWLEGVARLGDGVTLEQANAEMDAIAAGLVELHPESNDGYAGVNLRPLSEDIVEPEMRLSILSLWGAVLFVLLIACANLANLTMTRATARMREFAIRSALGAGPWRLARQLLVESLVLSLIGGALGYLVAVWAIDLTIASAPGDVAMLQPLVVDHTVLVYCLALGAVTAVAFGLAPAVHVMRADLVAVIKDGEARGGSSPGLRLTRNALAVAQVALALMLLAGAGVLIRSMRQQLTTDPGVDVDRIAVARVSLPAADYRTGEERIAFVDELIPNASGLPGVEATGAVRTLPLSGSNWSSNINLEGEEVPAATSDMPWSNVQIIAGDYFEVMGIPVLHGRAFDSGDTSDSLRVVVVSREFMTRYTGGEDPTGRRVIFGRPGEGTDGDAWYTIVGVVEDVYHNGVRSALRPELYQPHSQSPQRYMSLVTSGERPDELLQPMLAALQNVDPNLPAYDVESLAQMRLRRVWGPYITAQMMGIFAGVALFLALVGVYGVMSYSVAHRTREIGVRMAVGASPGEIVRMVLRQGARLGVIGLAIGLVGGLFLNRALESLLHEVSPSDPGTFASVSALLLATVLVACWIPARRASGLQPMEALRYE